MFFFFSLLYLVPQDVHYIIITKTELTELEKILQDLKMSNKTLQTDSQNLPMRVKKLRRMLKEKEVTLNSLKAEIEAKQKKIDRIIAIIFLTAIFIIFLMLINLPYLIM